jgi:3-phenylpropionate/trans-cinnamate dioxygenase ferredoxin reductase subunit
MSNTLNVKYLIIGGGAAGANAAVGIRSLDKEGSVLIVGQEGWWPYDRPPLSKTLLQGKSTPEDAESKDPSWYPKNDVQVSRKVRAVELDLAAKSVTLDEESVVTYEKLLIATGARPKKLGVKGEDLVGVHLFRTIEDSLSVREALTGAKKTLLVGSGYIGIEVGAAALTGETELAILDPGDRPLSKSTSPTSGKFIQRYFESKGATFYFQEEVAEILGENRVEGVLTKSGKRIACDLLVIGVGIDQNLELAESAGLATDEKNGIIVDETLRSEDPSVYVAGDAAAFYDVNLGKRWHAGHYLNAKWQGALAGKNMAGGAEKYDKIPYFFSDFLDLHLVLRGDPTGGKVAKMIGDPTTGEFIELSRRDDGTLAMGLAVSRDESKLDRISDKLEELFRAKALVEDLDDSSFN